MLNFGGVNGVNWGHNPLILTIDPNFLGHQSSWLVFFSMILLRGELYIFSNVVYVYLYIYICPPFLSP